MKTLKALIATAILGTSTLAAAQPSYYQPEYEQDRSEQFHHQQRRGAMMLAQNLELDRRQPAFISLDGRVSQLRFDADDGRVFIDSIVVMYANGQSQTLAIKQRLSDRSQPLTVNVDGRVTGIYVYGMSRRGSLDVVGIRSSGGYQRWNDSRWNDSRSNNSGWHDSSSRW